MFDTIMVILTTSFLIAEFRWAALGYSPNWALAIIPLACLTLHSWISFGATYYFNHHSKEMLEAISEELEEKMKESDDE